MSFTANPWLEVCLQWIKLQIIPHYPVFWFHKEVFISHLTLASWSYCVINTVSHVEPIHGWKFVQWIKRNITQLPLFFCSNIKEGLMLIVIKDQVKVPVTRSQICKSRRTELSPYITYPDMYKNGPVIVVVKLLLLCFRWRK